MKLSQKGFSLLEILVVLTLLAVVYFSIPSLGGGSSREDLDEGIQKITRSIRFAQSESILRNTIIRLKLVLSGEEEQSYSVDFGPSDTLPLPELKDTRKLSLREREVQAKVVEHVDRQFQQVPELEDQDLKFPEDITLQGVGLAEKDLVQTDEVYSLYFFPTGEKNSNIIFISSLDELATIVVHSFSDDIDISYHKLTGEQNALEMQNLVKNLYNKWRKN